MPSAPKTQIVTPRWARTYPIASVDDSSGRNGTWTSMAPAWQSSRTRYPNVTYALTLCSSWRLDTSIEAPPFPATAATTRASKCVSLVSSFPRAHHADAAITGTVHRSTHGAQVPRREHLRFRQEPSCTPPPPSPPLAHPKPHELLFLFRSVPVSQKTTSPPEGSVSSSNSDERLYDTRNPARYLDVPVICMYVILLVHEEMMSDAYRFLVFDRVLWVGRSDG